VEVIGGCVSSMQVNRRKTNSAGKLVHPVNHFFAVMVFLSNLVRFVAPVYGWVKRAV
jgi:hypothetical protein